MKTLFLYAGIIATFALPASVLGQEAKSKSLTGKFLHITGKERILSK
jgi:hypothetical protein